MRDLLIVIDMQKDFIDGSLGTKEAEAIVTDVIQLAEEFPGDVIFTRDTHTEDYLNTSEGKHLPVKHCIKGTEGWELEARLEAVREKRAALVFDKITFGSKELAAYLAQEAGSELSSVTLCGLCTDICVISNALMIKAFLPEIPIRVKASCCAGVTPASHENALEAMKMCQIEII